MDSFCRWVASHHKPVRTVLSVLLGLGIATLILRFDFPYLLAFLLIIPCSVLLVTALVSCGGRFLNRALRIMMDQCDPYPFLHELQTQLSYGYAPGYELTLRLNLATALYNTGSAQVALNVMKLIPIEKTGRATSLIKAMYYNNLTTFSSQMGDNAGAEDAYEKFLELANGMAKKALEKHYPQLMPLAEAGHLYRMGEYAAALEKCRSVPLNTAYDRVSNACFRARCAIALEDQDTARRELNYVIAHGNKLAMVQDAWAMLKKLDLED